MKFLLDACEAFLIECSKVLLIEKFLVADKFKLTVLQVGGGRLSEEGAQIGCQ